MERDDDDERPSRFGRRVWLRASTAVGVAALVPGCDAPAPVEGDAGPADGGAPVTPDAGAPIPPAPRTYATFEHGVASGDPLPDAVILWTRVTPGMPGEPDPGSIEVSWEIATDAAFASVVASGATSTDASRDFTVKVDATGLAAGTTHYFRFASRGDTSPVGRARTAPSDAIDHLRFAVCSCASLAHGWFHAYRQIAERADLDAVLHLGDYIYEYGTREYGRVRAYEPDHEIVTLDDYRLRYSLYRRDPDLQEAHRQHAFVHVWDDHETANNAYREGAENHQEDEGSWSDRLAFARQAFYEWLPIREDAEGKLWRKLAFGELVDLIVLDARVWGREEQGSEPDQLLGADQEAWLLDQLRTSSAQWKVVAQQVVMAQWSGFTNEDAWDGYPDARARLFSVLRTESIEDVVVLTGDIHSSWAMDLTEDPTDESAYDPATGQGSLAVEIVTPAVTSPGFLGLLERVAQTIAGNNRHIHWADGAARGYVVLDLKPDRAHADWFHVGDVEAREETGEVHAAAYATETGAKHLEAQAAPAPPRAAAPALAP